MINNNPKIYARRVILSSKKTNSVVVQKTTHFVSSNKKTKEGIVIKLLCYIKFTWRKLTR